MQKNDWVSIHEGRAGLTGHTLKIMGIILMVFDHVHQMFYMFGAPVWLTMLGRTVAPVFLFLSAEAFHYTRSRKNYMLRLLIGFWLMGLTTLLVQRLLPLEDVVLTNNIFGTLFLAVFYMWMTELLERGYARKDLRLLATGLLGMLAPPFFGILTLSSVHLNYWLFVTLFVLIPSPLTVEGGFAWIGLGLAFHLFRSHRRLQVAALAVLAGTTYFLNGGFQWMMVFASIPILCYNGKPGRKSKYFFYVFYPLHIYLLYVASYLAHLIFPLP